MIMSGRNMKPSIVPIASWSRARGVYGGPPDAATSFVSALWGLAPPRIERGSVSRILSRRDIHLRGLPEGSNGPFSGAFLLGLAPTRVCRAGPVARAAGGLLHHRFTLA